MEIHKRGSICHFPGHCYFPKPVQLGERKSSEFHPFLLTFILPAFLNTQNHLTFLKFLVIQGIKMNLEEAEDGSLILPRTHQVTGPEALSLQARGLFHTDGNREGPKPHRKSHGLRTPLPRQSLCRRKGEAQGFHIAFACLPFDIVLSYISCAITKNEGGHLKTGSCCCIY